MAVCESQLESGLARLNREGSDDTSQERTLPAGLPLTVDYRSPVSHFVPPAVELYAAARHKQEQHSSAESSETTTPVKRKRGRPRVDKTSPEYLANLAARKQAREMEALERKTKREYKRRSTADSGASSSTGDTTPRVKRKYTKRAPSQKKNDGTPSADRVKGKRGRPRKTDQMNPRHQQPKIRVRSNLMPINNEPISLDSDDEPDLGSPGATSDSLSLDENLRALRHIHEKYANIEKDDLYEAHLLAAKFKKPPHENRPRDDDVLSIRSSEGGNSVKELDTRVEKLEDSSNSDSDSSSSGSGSSSSGSSSSSSCSSSSSDSSDSEPETNHKEQATPQYTSPLWSAPASEEQDSGSSSDPERGGAAPPSGGGSHDEISESDNESPDKSFQCHICRKWYSTRVTLKIHRRSHQQRGGGSAPRARQRSSDRYECDICSEAFPRREKLYAHKAEAHRGAMTFRCEVCRRCFEHDDELAAHRDLHTPDERNGRCGQCGLVFPRWEQLRRHRACAHGAPPPSSDGALPHACAHCGKRFSHVHSLTRHLHNHAKQLYRCVVCKASFARAEQLAQHLNSHLANYKRLKP